MSKYPDFVKRYKPKGTIVKKVRGDYYVYKATSKRIPGKSYPVQVIEGLIGKIDKDGFHELYNTLVDSRNVIIREYGFSNYLLLFEEAFIADSNTHRRKSELSAIYRSIIVYLSSNSFLTDDESQIIYGVDELVSKFKISMTKQINALLRILELESLNVLEPLKYICRVKMGNKVFKSKLNKIQRDLLDKLRVDEDEIR